MHRIPAAVLAACLAASPLAAQQAEQPLCAARATIVANLAEHYGEQPAGAGLDGNGMMVEVFASPKGSWTLIVSGPAGIACVVATGEGWQPAAPGKGRDS